MNVFSTELMNALGLFVENERKVIIYGRNHLSTAVYSKKSTSN